ncbi:MAG: lipoyl synthase [Nitrospirota bacterium]|nr:lipoyl synthase [Nitrospirota bacterium]
MAVVRLPPWMTGRPHAIGAADPLKAELRRAGLVTVCEEARCPNLAECFGRGVATFMILGDTCTRACAFCAVATGTPAPPDRSEPERLAQAAARMGLSHVVITSVDRDDLPDGGAGQFVAAIRAVRKALPAATVEVLTPDFQGNLQASLMVAEAGPEVFNHNLETVSRLYPDVRPGADYGGSLEVLAAVKEKFPHGVTKSGLMAGLGETDAELIDLFRDLRETGRCDVLTVGQYLRPTAAHRPVARYLTPAEFAGLKEKALKMGFHHVSAGPRVRSSFNAGGLLAALRGREGRQ